MTSSFACRDGPTDESRGASAVRRSAARAAAGAHSAHPLAELPPELLAEYDGPVGIGIVIRADTPNPVDVAALVSRVRAEFRSAEKELAAGR